jgi:hypothetical protein
MRPMNPAWLAWGLALAAFGVAWLNWGWRGAIAAITVVVFWLLLQFNRSVRALRIASGRPVGTVHSAVMLHARLHAGMRLVEILKITRSLGHRVAEPPDETFVWRDAGGDAVEVVLRDGRVSAVRLRRAAAAEAAGVAPPAAG